MGHGRSTTSTFISARRSTCAPAGEWSGNERERAVVAGDDLAEKIDARHEVLRAEAVLAELDEEVVPRVSMTVVTRLLIPSLARTSRDERRVRVAASVSCQPAGVGRRSSRAPAPMSDMQHAAAREERGVLRLERVGHVVPLERLVAVVEERRHVGPAQRVGETKTWCRFTIADQPPPAASSSRNSTALEAMAITMPLSSRSTGRVLAWTPLTGRRLSGCSWLETWAGSRPARCARRG